MPRLAALALVAAVLRLLGPRASARAGLAAHSQLLQGQSLAGRDTTYVPK